MYFFYRISNIFINDDYDIDIDIDYVTGNIDDIEDNDVI